MFQLDAFIVQGHRKIIDHFRWLRDTATSDVERERFQRRMVEEYEALKLDTWQRPHGAQRAA
jgi:ribosomal protein L32E